MNIKIFSGLIKINFLLIVLSLLIAWAFSSVYAIEFNNEFFLGEIYQFEKSLDSNEVRENVEFRGEISFKEVFTKKKSDKDNKGNTVENFTKILSDNMVNREIIIDEEINLDNYFEKYGQMYGISEEKMKSTAKCESGLNPLAINQLYTGLFQFSPSTWISNRKAMGEDFDLNLRFLAEESIKTAAFKMSRDGFGAWPSCAK